MPVPATNVLAAMTYWGRTRPVSAPPMGDASISPAAMGINKYPVSVAPYPKNVDAKTGIKNKLPIMPMNTIKLLASVFTRAVILKNLKSTMGSL